MSSQAIDKKNSEEKFIDFYFVKISTNVIYTYVYLIASVLLSTTNRYLYQRFNFKFNFTLMFLQQIFCFFVFFAFCIRNKEFIKQSGEISMKDFKSLKFQYLLFSALFAMNHLSSFIANQLVVNIAMYLVLRKCLTVMSFFYDILINKKMPSKHLTFSVTMITIGTLITGYNDITADYFGYCVVLFNNILSLFYAQFTDKFNKKYNCSNIKLLVYNSAIVPPIMLVLFFATGEYKRLIEFIKAFDQSQIFYLIFALTISCSLCVVLNLCYLISNEKNSSLFTLLLSNCKDILMTAFSFIVIKESKGKMSSLIGISVSSLGAIVFSVKSAISNMKFKNKKKVS